jgi:hypothetical protein
MIAAFLTNPRRIEEFRLNGNGSFGQRRRCRLRHLLQNRQAAADVRRAVLGVPARVGFTSKHKPLQLKWIQIHIE